VFKDNVIMKVLNLQCAQHHRFEGWFASETDFSSQLSRGLVECPICADTGITKMLTAPRLNLGSPREEEVAPVDSQELVPMASEPSLQEAWLQLARRIVAQTDDVGTRFAEEARKIHYGELPERGIRGQATVEETQALVEEGIDVMPLLLPDAVKKSLH
jgi:hypothetical protein